MNIGEEIVKIRTVIANCSQQAFADILYKDQRTVSSYERNIISPPVDVLQQIAKEFNVKIEITPTGIIVKEIVDMKKDIREEMYNFIMNNALSDDFKKSDLLDYECLVREYKDRLPIGFEEDIERLGITKEKVCGAITKDEYEQLGIFYMGENKGTTLLYCSEENNKWWYDEGRYRVISDDTTSVVYKYGNNPLWLVYLERDIENINKETFIKTFYSSIFGLIIESDERVENLKNLDIDALKEYTDDYSVDKEYVKAYIWDRGDGYVIIDRYFEGDDYNEYYKAYKCLVEIPSKEILLCPINSLGESNIVVSKEYREYLRETYLS